MTIYTYGQSANNTQKFMNFFDLNSLIILSSPSTLRNESYIHVAVKVSYHRNMYFEPKELISETKIGGLHFGVGRG
jgi:hypothetical protein